MATELEQAPSGKTARPGSKELRALGKQFKQGYRWQRSGGGHWRITDRDGHRVEHRDKAITVSDNPSPGVLRAFEQQLREARVLRGTDPRPLTPDAVDRRTEATRRVHAERQERRQREANELRERYVAVFKNMGGLETPGLGQDLGQVARYLLRDTPRTGMTPDLLAGSATRAIVQGAWSEPKYRDVWMLLIERLEGASDPIGEWHNLLRDAKGLPASSVRFRLPKDAQDEWPFRVELLPLDALLVDMTYQRPPSWLFIRTEAARYDPTLVGTIDVAQRAPGHFAILDGQQRIEIIRLVGKQTVWASIYVGLDLASEARFFLHKNANRKNVHPYYTFRAMVASEDPDALAIEATVEQHGYKLAIGAPKADDSTSNNIAAIAAVMKIYERRLPDGTPTLDPVLAVLAKATRGRNEGQSALMIRGLSAALLARPDVDLEHLTEAVSTTGPTLLLGRARDLKRAGAGSVTGEQAVARVILSEYDRATRKRRNKAAA